MVNRMLIHRSAPHPRSRKTPRGGRKMARMILQISETGERHVGGSVVVVDVTVMVMLFSTLRCIEIASVVMSCKR